MVAHPNRPAQAAHSDHEGAGNFAETGRASLPVANHAKHNVWMIELLNQGHQQPQTSINRLSRQRVDECMHAFGRPHQPVQHPG